MAYVLTILAILGIFLWSAPAKTFVADHVRAGRITADSAIASGSAPLKAKMNSAVDSIRNKTMEMLREQLHRFVDGMVQ